MKEIFSDLRGDRNNFFFLIHTLNVCQLAGASPRPDSSGSGFVFVGDDLKLVLLVRNDLGMSPGKIAAQCCHAALGAQRVNAPCSLPIMSKLTYFSEEMEENTISK
jgi:hypothetical protein